MSFPKEIKPKVEVFVNAAKYHFDFLKDYNYNIEKIGIATKYVVDYITEVVYQNDALDRKLVIHYEPIDIDNDVVDLVSIYIYI